MHTVSDVLQHRAPWAVISDDCIRGMATLPDGCVHCVATSPPYFALRDYGVDGQIGLEETPAAYVEKMVAVFREVRRILHPSGVIFLNLGDSYCNAGSSNNGTGLDGNRRGGATGADGELGYKNRDLRRSLQSEGIKHKDLMGIPWRVAFALQADGWWLRQDIIWAKPNPMPSSVTDRCTTAHEYVFLLTKEQRYFFDAQAIAEPAKDASKQRAQYGFNQTRRDQQTADVSIGSNERTRLGLRDQFELPPTANKRSVWKVATRSYKGAHFATWPPKLVEPMILAGTSAKGVCPQCGEPWRRVVKKVRKATRPGTGSKVTGDSLVDGNRDPERHVTATETVGWEQGCRCPAHEPVPAVVFDPFTGSGTTLAVAVENGRRALGTELNPEYLPLIGERMRGVIPDLFAGVDA